MNHPSSSHAHKVVEYDQCHSSEPSLEIFDTPLPEVNTTSTGNLWGPTPLKNLRLWIVYPPSLEQDALYLLEWFSHRSGIEVCLNKGEVSTHDHLTQLTYPFSCSVHHIHLQDFLHGIDLEKSYFLFVYHESVRHEYTALMTRAAWFNTELLKRCRVTSVRDEIPPNFQLFMQISRQRALWSLISQDDQALNLLQHSKLWKAYQDKVLRLERIQSLAYMVAGVGLLGVSIGIWGQGSDYAFASTLLYMFACLIWGMGSIMALWSWLDLRAFKQRVLLYWIDPSLNTATDQLKKKSQVIKYKFKHSHKIDRSAH